MSEGTKKRRPGFYGRVYGDFGTHPKVTGGMLGEARVKRLSLAARGLWVSLVSLVIRRETDGLFSSEDAEAEGGAEAVPLLAELMSNGMVDQGRSEGVYVLHDWESNGPSVSEYRAELARKRTNQNGYRSRVAAVTGNKPDHVPGHVTDHSLDLSLSEISDQREKDRDRKPAAPVTGNAPETTKVPDGAHLAEAAREAVRAAMTKRGAAAPRDCDQPMAPVWEAVALHVVKTARVTGEDPKHVLKLTVRGFADHEGMRAKGWPMSYLAKNPQEFLTAGRHAA